MKILEIHQVQEGYLNKNIYKNFDILTFDDGLYSQFYYLDFFKSLNKPLIFFISSGIINNNNKFEFKDCLNAHNDFFLKNDTSAYMSIQQIQIISKEFEIGWHTHFHPLLTQFSKINQLQIILNEIKLGSDFIKKFGCKSFCFPYNNKNNFFEYNLKKNNFNTFFGSERINLENYLGIEQNFKIENISSHYEYYRYYKNHK